MTSRVLSRDYRLKANSPSGTIADQDTFTYDSSSRMLTGISGRYSNTVTNTFDNAGRLSTESLTIGGQTYTATNEYDLRSQRKKVTYPNSSTWERTYTARRQLYETKYNGSTVDTRVYDDGGRLDTSTYANGVAADYNWRADNLLADIGFSHPGSVAANRRIGTYTYAWDANKNKTKETITGQIPGYSFDTTLGTDPDGYDDEDRLTYFKRQSTTNPQTWNLSLVGDWNSWSNFGTAQSRTHGPAHEILTAGNTPNNAFTHDVKGNMTDIPSNILSPARKLFWDFDNQLTGVDTSGDSTPEVTYEYDVLHRRVARIEGSNSKIYIHSGNQIIADYNRGSAANTTPAFRYVWGDYIDEPILRQTGSTTILYYHRNQQYSIIALTNTSGEVVERYGYTAYGQMTVMNYLGNVRSWSDWSNRFLYTGREWDDTTKLFHFRARWYEPVAGRFVSRDPLGYVDGMGLYSGYFGLFQTDPFGLLLVDDGWGYSEWVWPWDPRASYNPCSTAKLWCEKTTLYGGAAIWGAGEGICNIGKGVGNTGVEITYCVRDVGVETFCTQRSELWSQTGNAIANGDLTCQGYYTDVGVNFVTFGCKGQYDTFQEWQCGNITWDEASERFGTAGCFQLVGARQCHNTGGIWVRPIKSLPRDIVTICSRKVPNQWALSPRACTSLAKDPFLGPCLDELATVGRKSASKCREFAWCDCVGVVGKSGNGQCAMINAVDIVAQPGLPVYISTGGVLCRKTPTLFLPRSPRTLFLPNCSKCLAEIRLRPELCPVPPKCPIITIPELLLPPTGPIIPEAFGK